MKRRLVPVSLTVSLLFPLACSMHMQARSSASGSGEGSGNAASHAAAEPKPEPPQKKSSGGKSWSASFHESGSVSAKIDWQGRSGRVCRAAAPFKFVGTARASGSAQLTPQGASATGKGEASGKTSGGQASSGDCSAPRSPVPKTPPPTPVTHPEKPEPAKPEKPKPQHGTDKKDPPKPPQHGTDKKDPPAKPKPPAGPTPAELEKPVEPPKEPPPNVFGYDKPVLGCFEGQVFPLADGAPKLPTNYEKLDAVSVVYACEWDIGPRAWDLGFPGVADRFEWFAIRYAGAFRILDAGEYTFRISSDDGTKLIIDGKQVIENDGQHPPKEATGKVKLEAGDHQMVLEYFQGPRFHINLQLWVTPPGKKEELFTVR